MCNYLKKTKISLISIACHALEYASIFHLFNLFAVIKIYFTYCVVTMLKILLNPYYLERAIFL